MTDLSVFRELDALVAEKIFGWKQDAPGSIWWNDGRRLREVPDYSTSIAAAWQVIERLGFVRLAYGVDPSKSWLGARCVVRVFDAAGYETGLGTANAAPLAICRAALAATRSSAVSAEASPADQD